MRKVGTSNAHSIASQCIKSRTNLKTKFRNTHSSSWYCQARCHAARHQVSSERHRTMAGFWPWEFNASSKMQLLPGSVFAALHSAPHIFGVVNSHQLVVS